jgi:hypothetical protein
MTTRANVALAAALAAWAAMAVFVLSSDEPSCSSSLGTTLLILGLWGLALGYGVWFVAVAPDRRSRGVVVGASVLLVVLLAAIAVLFGLACG